MTVEAKISTTNVLEMPLSRRWVQLCRRIATDSFRSIVRPTARDDSSCLFRLVNSP